MGTSLVCLCSELLDRQSADAASKQPRRHPQRQMPSISSIVDRASLCTKPGAVSKLRDDLYATRIR